MFQLASPLLLSRRLLSRAPAARARVGSLRLLRFGLLEKLGHEAQLARKGE
jgi:hypothetical protein